MNRSGYTESDDDISDEHVELWRRTVAEAIASPEGQALLRELACALDALPDKWLIEEQLVDEEGDCCAIGAVCRARGIGTEGMDDGGMECVAERLGVPWPIVCEIVNENDGYRETPEDRWQRMRRWVERHITKEE